MHDLSRSFVYPSPPNAMIWYTIFPYTQTPSLCHAQKQMQFFHPALYNQTKFPNAMAAIIHPATQIGPNELVLAPALDDPAVNWAVLTLVLPVAVIPFKLSAVSILGPTFQKSTSMKVGFSPHSLWHSTPFAPSAPVSFVLGEFVVAISCTSGIVIEKASEVSAKWFIRPR